ncbi:MAG TPA: glycosyltransferase family 4 protein [Candidatus Dormibacteraeota bacterium]|nr:glycosyltransferase family 4 protein [Candidatus Dormibacteraeota bacterium]
MSGLRFCLVTTFYPPYGFGGDAVHVRRLAEGLAERGHAVRVVHNPNAQRLLGGTPAPDVPDNAGIEVVAAPSGRLAGPETVATYLGGRATGYRRRLAGLMAGFDVVHFHNPSLIGGPAALHAGGATALRLYTTHEHWLICPTHVLFRFGREVCERRTCWRCTVAHGRPPQLWRSTGVLPRAVAALDAVICPSRFTAGLHRAEFPGARVEIMAPLFLPPAAATEAEGERDATGSRPYFLFAGRLEPIKGADRLARAFGGVRGADLVVAGTGGQAAELESIAARNPAIRLLGRVPHARVLELARGALALVVPSAGYETFGGAAVEAMGMGTPAVVRRIGPLPELVDEGGGMSFGDDGELVEALQRLVDDPALARRLGAEARRIARTRFADEVHFRQYFGLIAELAGGRGLQRTAERARAAVEALGPAA